MAEEVLCARAGCGLPLSEHGWDHANQCRPCPPMNTESTRSPSAPLHEWQVVRPGWDGGDEFNYGVALVPTSQRGARALVARFRNRTDAEEYLAFKTAQSAPSEGS